MRCLKKEIKVVPTEDLNIRYCRILERAEILDANDIPVADAREILWIEEELHSRLLKHLDGDPYPPDRSEKEAPSNYMISLLKSRKKSPPSSAAVTKEVKTEGNLSFKIVITSSIGHKVTEQNVRADSKSDVAVQAERIIKKLGLKRATYKIS